MEEFRIIEGLENYSVSNFGNVKNNITKRILKSSISNGYKVVKLYKDNKTHKNYKIHRLVATSFILNPDNKQCIDHIDNIRSNNNINNLRWCSLKENSYNKKISKNNTSGFKGVHLEHNKWRVQIRINGKNKHLGLFDNIEDAIIARYNKAKELYGEFLNEVEINQYNIALLKKNKEEELKEIEMFEKELQ
jgi:hypothetical protein